MDRAFRGKQHSQQDTQLLALGCEGEVALVWGLWAHPHGDQRRKPTPQAEAGALPAPGGARRLPLPPPRRVPPTPD